MPPAVAKAAFVVAALLAGQGEAGAHALAQRYDLPLPLEYFVLAAGAVVGVSFIIVALFMRPRGATRPSALAHKSPTPRVVPRAVVIPGQIAGVGILILLIAAGLFGQQGTFKNIVPVTVWVIWWVGFGLVSAFVGNVWELINPWIAVAEWFDKLIRRRIEPAPVLRYPAWLGAWPACGFFLLFAWFELVAAGRDVPRNIAIAIAIYSAITWLGCILFGRATWLKSVEVFSIVFGLLGRFAPLQFTRDERLRWRLVPYASGLLTPTPLSPSMIAFTLLVLGTVTADGVMETPLWSAMIEPLLPGGEAVNAARYRLLATLLVILVPLSLAALYVSVVWLMTRMVRGPDLSATAGYFVLSLVPIAIAYHLSHYFSLLAVAGQFIIPLASDPFGYGWDLFGTTLYRIDIGIVDARFIWYLSMVAIVSGHIIAVCLAHITAFSIYRNTVAARRSQYPLLVLMIGYTMLSLWILAEPITRGP